MPQGCPSGALRAPHPRSGELCAFVAGPMTRQTSGEGNQEELRCQLKLTELLLT